MIQRNVENRLLLSGWETPGQVAAEFGFEQGKTLATAAPVSYRVLDQHFVQPAGVLEFNAEGVGE